MIIFAQDDPCQCGDPVDRGSHWCAECGPFLEAARATDQEDFVLGAMRMAVHLGHRGTAARGLAIALMLQDRPHDLEAMRKRLYAATPPTGGDRGGAP